MTTRWDITKAVRASDLSAPAKLIMLVLADVAEVGTAEIPERFTPSLAVLVQETGLARSTVQTYLARLEDAGWIARTRPETPEAMWRGDRVRYRLSIPEGVPLVGIPLARESDQGVPMDGPGVARESAGGSPTVGPLETNLSDQDQITSDPSLPHKSAAPKPRQRGTRLPENFAVTPEMRAWAMANVPQLAGSRETEKFANYWRAKAGRDACKLDWVATWKNWMLTAAERTGKKPPPRASVLDDPDVRAATRELFPDRQEGAA